MNHVKRMFFSWQTKYAGAFLLMLALILIGVVCLKRGVLSDIFWQIPSQMLCGYYAGKLAAYGWSQKTMAQVKREFHANMNEE